MAYYYGDKGQCGLPKFDRNDELGLAKEQTVCYNTRLQSCYLKLKKTK